MIQTAHIETQTLSWSVKKQSILQNVNLQVANNLCLGLIGPNGSGKTSLLRCLYGSITPTTGSIALSGQCYSSISRAVLAQQIAVVLQDSLADIHLRVCEILRLGRLASQQLLQRDRRFFTDDEKKIIGMFQLESLLHRDYDTLSGGEKQRVMITRALIQKPSVLILDEPTNHLDIAHQLALLRYLRALSITVICSLHDLNLAAQYCDEVAVMQRGRLIRQGTPDDVLQPDLLQTVFSVRALRDYHPKIGALRLSYY